MSKEAMKLALEGAANYIDALGGDSRKYRQALAEQPAQQEPVALKWQQSPIRTAWGDDMVVASVAIDNDHTLSLYCERDQTPKVDAMFAQRTWVGLTDEERGQAINANFGTGLWAMAKDIEAKLREKNA